MRGQVYPTEPLLKCSDVRVRFGGIVALDGVSLEVPKGQVVGIIGPNGAGKTTLFNCISGLYKVNEGDIQMQGQSLLKLQSHEVAQLGVARTFQNVALFESMTVRENVVVGAHPRSQSGVVSNALSFATSPTGRALDKEIDELLVNLDLAQYANRRVGDLSFGIRKQVELARAMAAKPQLLMLDEPAGGLNHGDVDLLRELIGRLRDMFGLTVLLVEHHMQFVMKLCDSIVALNFGKHLAHGTPEEIRNHPDVISAYLGGAA